MSLLQQLSKTQIAVNNILANRAVASIVTVDLDNYTITIPDWPEPTIYKPTQTALNFHKRDERVRVIRGHVGSGKSTMMCAEIVFRAINMAACKDGVIRSRWAIVRNTYGDLARTTLTTWRMWFSNLGLMKWREGKSFTITHTLTAVVIKDGVQERRKVEFELLPIALDNVADVTKHLKSLEVTGVFLNELSELSKAVLDFFTGGRLPRYPAKKDMPDGISYWCGLFGDTNPPEEDSWIYKMFEVDRPTEHIMLCQPPAVLKMGAEYVINPDAENIRNILNGESEYVKMTWGKDEAFIRVYLMGEYGTLSDQKRVYGGYNDNIHSSDTITIDYNSPLIIAADLGTVAPAIGVSQMQGSQLVCIKEFCGEFTTIRELCTDVVMPWLHDNCKGMRVEAVIYDPADTYDGSEQLRTFFGAAVRPAQTNSVSLRIDAVSLRLARLVKGHPIIIFSRQGCPQTRKGFNGKYYYRRVQVIGENRYTDEPHKNHPYSDCISINTKILLANGKEIKLKHLRVGMFVKTNKEDSIVSKVWLARKNAVVYKYKFSNGSSLIATPDHRVYTSSGWKKLCDLTEHDVLWSIQNHKGESCIKFGNVVSSAEMHSIKLLSVRKCWFKKNVYDLTVEDAHCFFANGILVHNCHDVWQYISLYVNYETNLAQDYDATTEALAAWEAKQRRSNADNITGY